MAKKIVKKVAKATKTVTKKTETTAQAKDLANITNCDDFYCMIRDKYNAKEKDTVTKETVSKVWNAFQEAFSDFAEKSDADKATCLLPNIGVLTIFIDKEHESINPRTRETVVVPTKKRVRFRAYPRFVKTINGED